IACHRKAVNIEVATGILRMIQEVSAIAGPVVGKLIRAVHIEKVVGSGSVRRFSVEIIKTFAIRSEHDGLAVRRPDGESVTREIESEAVAKIMGQILDPDVVVAGSLSGEGHLPAIGRQTGGGKRHGVAREGDLVSGAVEPCQALV